MVHRALSLFCLLIGFVTVLSHLPGVEKDHKAAGFGLPVNFFFSKCLLKNVEREVPHFRQLFMNAPTD